MANHVGHCLGPCPIHYAFAIYVYFAIYFQISTRSFLCRGKNSLIHLNKPPRADKAGMVLVDFSGVNWR